jgi:1-acyl-sn-glycerol-3-phosphate acyltransferase
VVVANHRGRLDALLMLSMLPSTGVVIKSDYARIPLYSSFVKHLDFVSINPDSLESLGAASAKCRQVLAKGVSLLVFPEGTRAKTGRLLAFRPFPFKIAMETGAPVVPVIIHSDLPFMARCRGSIFPKYRFRYTIRFLPAQRPRVGEAAPDFAQRVRATMAGQLALLDKGTYWDAGKKDTA